jgi:hypothetical protein
MALEGYDGCTFEFNQTEEAIYERAIAEGRGRLSCSILERCWIGERYYDSLERFGTDLAEDGEVPV